jgi:hypothetical protein
VGVGFWEGAADLSSYPDLVVIYLGMRVNSSAGLRTLISFGQFLRDRGGTGFWHETYFRGGQIESVYIDMPGPAWPSSPRSRRPVARCFQPAAGSPGVSDVRTAIAGRYQPAAPASRG